jgi:hypothetical protein
MSLTDQEQYVKDLERDTEQLRAKLEENSELSDLFKYMIVNGKLEVVLNASGDYVFTYRGNMLNSPADVRIKDFCKKYGKLGYDQMNKVGESLARRYGEKK